MKNIVCKNCKSIIKENCQTCPVCKCVVSLKGECPYCGRDYEGTPYFCNFCGKPLFIANQIPKHNLNISSIEEKSLITCDNKVETDTQIINFTSITNPDLLDENCDLDINSNHIISQNINSDYNINIISNTEEATDKSNEKSLNDERIKDKLADGSMDVVDDDSDKNNYKNTTSKYIQKKMMISTEEELKEQQEFDVGKSSKRISVFLILLFLTIISIGVIYFILYDHKFNERKSIQDKHIADSIKAVEQDEKDRHNREKELADSLSKIELSQIHKEDSIENIRKHEEWVKDSVIIDKRMVKFVHSISQSNLILAKYLSYNNCVCYYTDTINPIFKLTCFDGMANEVSNILIDNIQCKLIGHFMTPDAKSFILLCKDDLHNYGMAYKINMLNNTIIDFKSMDEDGNKCFDIGKSNNGFYMKYGKADNNSFKKLYSVYYDKYGNYINKE